MRKTRLPSGVEAWALSPSKYISKAVKNIETHLATEYGGMKLAKRANSPFPSDYMPELDITPELGPKQAQYYHTLVSVLQ